MTVSNNDPSNFQPFQFQPAPQHSPQQFPPPGNSPNAGGSCFIVFGIFAAVLCILAALLFLVIKNLLPLMGLDNESVNKSEMSRGNYPSRIPELREYFASPKNDIGDENLSELKQRLVYIIENSQNATRTELSSMIDFRRMVKQVQDSPVCGPNLTGITESFLSDGETIAPAFTTVEIVAVRQSIDDPREVVVSAICGNDEMRGREICYWMRNDTGTWRLFDWMVVGGGISGADELAVLNSMVSDRLFTTITRFHDLMDAAFESIEKGDMDDARDRIETAERLDLIASPLFAQSRLRLAIGYINIGEFKSSLEQLKQIGDARNTPAKEQLAAICHNGLGNYQQAIDAAQRYIDIVGASPDMLEEQHLALWSLNQFEKAWDARFKKAMYLPDNLNASTDLIEVTPLSKLDHIVQVFDHHLSRSSDDVDSKVEALDRFTGNAREAGLELLIRKAERLASERVLEGLRANLDFEREQFESGLVHRQRQMELTNDADARLAIEETLHYELIMKRMFARSYEVANDKSESLHRLGQDYIDGYYQIAPGQLESIAARHMLDFPDDLWAKYYHAIAVGDQFRREEAIAQLQEILDLQVASSDDVDEMLNTNTRTSLSIFLFASGQCEKAVRAHTDAAQAIDDYIFVAVRKQDFAMLRRLLALADEAGLTFGKKLEIGARLLLAEGKPKAAIDLLADDRELGRLSDDELESIRNLHVDTLLDQVDMESYDFPQLSEEQYFDKCSELFYSFDIPGPMQRLLDSAPVRLKSHDRHRYYRTIHANKTGDAEATTRLLGNPGWYLTARKLEGHERLTLKYIDLLLRLKSGDYDGAKQICWKGKLTATSTSSNEFRPGPSTLGNREYDFDYDDDQMAAMEWLVFLLEGNSTACRRVEREHPEAIQISGYNIFDWLSKLDVREEILNSVKLRIAKRLDPPFKQTAATFLFETVSDPTLQTSLVDRKFAIDGFSKTEFAVTNKVANRCVVQLASDDLAMLAQAENGGWLGWDIYSDAWLIDVQAKSKSWVSFSSQRPRTSTSEFDSALGNRQFRDWLIEQIATTNPVAVLFDECYVVMPPAEATDWLKSWSPDTERKAREHWNACISPVNAPSESKAEVQLRRSELVRHLETFDPDAALKIYVKLNGELDFDPELGWFRVDNLWQTDDTWFNIECEVVSPISSFGPGLIVGEKFTADFSEVEDWKIE